MNVSCPELYIEEAENVIKTLSFFGFCCGIDNLKYQNIANLYKVAGKMLKMSDLNLSLECYEKSIYYYKKVNKISNDLGESYLNCGIINCNEYFKNIDYNKAIYYYLKSIDIYLFFKNDTKITKLYENIGDIYCILKDYNNAIIYYNKILPLLYNLVDEMVSLFKKDKIYNKLISIYIININDYDTAIKLYNEIINFISNVKNIISMYIYQKYYIKIIFLYICIKDYDKAINNVNTYIKNNKLENIEINLIDYNLINYYKSKYNIITFEYIIINSLLKNIICDNKNNNNIIELCNFIIKNNNGDKIIEFLINKIINNL
jgi:tetratricopeptide (TPR) repeat protein